MSKKSRKRNKRILAVLGVGAAAAMAAKKKRDLAGTENNKGGIDTIAKAKQSMTKDNAYKLDSKKKDTGPVKTSTTVMDSMPAKAKTPRNKKSIRVKTNTNKVYTDATGGESTAKVGNKKSVFKGADGYLRQGENSIPMTPGRFGTFKASKDIAKGAKPANLGLKSGGRAGYKSGGSSVKKSMGKALRGGGKVMR